VIARRALVAYVPAAVVIVRTRRRWNAPRPASAAVAAAAPLALGCALVYTGEHYVIDLLAGLALAAGVQAAVAS
jgi:hypothetical protein